MPNILRTKQAGYIALMATIVISLILLVMTIEESSSGWYARFNILGTEAKEQASSLAEGCADQALAAIITNPSYTGNTSITTSGGTCHIFPILFDTPSAGFVTIKTQAEVRGSFANLNTQTNLNDIHLGSTPAAPTKGTLVIITQVINDSSGTKSSSDFTMHVSGSNPSQTTFSGSDSGVVVTVDPIPAGNYQVTEDAVVGYSTSISTNCDSVLSGRIAAGEIKFCTITNDDITTTLTVIANVTNDNAGTKQPTDFPLFIDGTAVTLGQRKTFTTAGSHTVSATTLAGYGASPWGYDCATDGTVTVNLGDNKTCIINYNDLPPPAPVCAETVMILDRTGSMSSTNLSDERTAATSLVNLYAAVTPLPKIGVGSIGAYPNASLPLGAAGIPLLGQLTTIYSNIISTIFTAPNLGITGSNSSVGSDLSAGLTVGNAELNSVRHVAGKEKVLILVSDGEPNQPSGSSAYDTGFKSPTADVQNGPVDLWSTPIGAYADGGGDANDPVSENDRHRFYNFGFGGGAGLPSGSTVSGIEASVDAWNTSSAGASVTTLTPSSTGLYDEWTPNTGTDVSSVATNDSDTSYIDTSSSIDSFTVPNSALPSGSTVNSVTITALARGTVAGAIMQLVAEKGSGGANLSIGPSNTLTTSYASYTRVMNTNPFTGSAWTLAEVNAWTTKFGVRTTNGQSVRVTQVSVSVSYNTATPANVQKTPTSSVAPNQWSTPNSAFLSDNIYTTDSTNGHQQGYGNFGFIIPAGATITGIQVTTEAKVSAAGTPQNTGTLLPNGQGSDTSWNGGESDVDESGTPDCSNGDRIDSNNNNNRESVNIDLSSIPNGSTVTSVQIFSWDQGNPAGGTYQTYARVNGTPTNSGVNLTTTSTNGCISRNQTIDIPDFVKSGSTDFEVGVIKIGNTEVRIGAIRAVVTYIPVNTGTLAIALSSNNGGTWTSSENVTVNTTEAVSSPAGNGPSDMWSRGWVPTDFNNGNFVLRVQNNSTTGTTVSLDQVTATVYYTTTSTPPPLTLTPSSPGLYDEWSANTGTDVSSVATNDSDTSYIDTSSSIDSFTVPNSALPSGSTVNSVTITALARGTVAGAIMQLVAEKGSGGANLSIGPSNTLTTSYASYTRVMNTNPFTGSAWTLAEVNAWTTKFGVRTTNGQSVRVTQVSVAVNYSPPNACQLGVDMSWNAGNSWSSEKTQTLSGVETTYTLGTPSDDWTSSHTWQPTDFSDANFRARVHAINPGSNCSASAVDHLDWLQLKVYYSQPVDPTVAAYLAADAAKKGPDGIAGNADDTDIFTIHFGSSAGRDLLAKLASGNTPNPPYQNGSYNDPGGVINGSSALVSPTLQSSDSGGDGDGFEVTPTNAFADGVSGLSGAAQNQNGAADRHRYYGYNFTIPPNATITGVETRLDWWLDSTSGTNSLGVELSWDGGVTWTAMKTDTNESTSVSNSRTLGSSSDTWGHTWTLDNFSNANFRVRLTSNSTVSTRDFFLDWVPVTVYYSVIQENGDGDNFFISPTSADMQGIFNFIGEQVCPAILNLAPPPPPTTATIIVMTKVINDNSGSLAEGAFTAHVTGISPSPTTITGLVTPTNVTVGPGTYSITEDDVTGYLELPGATCSSDGSSGSIVAGETRVCILTNDDVPPPPPPPNFNINTGSWNEVPNSN